MTEHCYVMKSVYFVVFHEVQKKNYLTAINCKLIAHSSSPVVVKVLNQPVVKEAVCLVFVLTRFLNNRKSSGEGGRMEGLLPVNVVNLSERAAAGARGTTLHCRNGATPSTWQLSRFSAINHDLRSYLTQFICHHRS